MSIIVDFLIWGKILLSRILDARIAPQMSETEIYSKITAYVAIIAFLIVPALLVRAARIPLARRDYIQRVVLGISFIAATCWTLEFGIILSALMFWPAIIILFLMFKWVARRCLDIGFSKWWALLVYVPVINVVMMIALFFYAAKPSSGPG